MYADDDNPCPSKRLIYTIPLKGIQPAMEITIHIKLKTLSVSGNDIYYYYRLLMHVTLEMERSFSGPVTSNPINTGKL